MHQEEKMYHDGPRCDDLAGACRDSRKETSIELRLAARTDLGMLTENRLAFVASLRPIADPGPFATQTRAYFERELGGENFAAALAEEDGRPVSVCMACLFDTLPQHSCPRGRVAELLSVWTEPAFRRRGLAGRLIGLLLGELRRRGADKVVLSCTEMGRPLYEELGFVLLDDEMSLRL